MPAPEFGATLTTEYLTGLGTVDGRMLILMDIEKLMTSREMALIETLGALSINYAPVRTTDRTGSIKMLSRWSIRTSLTMVGIILVALTVVVGALGLTALNRREPVARPYRARRSGRHSCARRCVGVSVALARSRSTAFNTLTAAGNADEAKTALDRAQELLDKGNESWQTFRRCAEERHRPGAARRPAREAARRVMHDGVDPEFAALRANDQARLSRDRGYEDQPDVHCLRRVRIGDRQGACSKARPISRRARSRTSR